MSVDVNWETLTGGPDGGALAETIRAFVHERFQHIPLPKLIRSVKVQSFDFGKIAPEIVLKDICDPLPDFYETDEDSEQHDDGAQDSGEGRTAAAPNTHSTNKHLRAKDGSRRPSELELLEQSHNPTLTRGTILGGASNFGYFHPAFKAGFSGTTTPLAAVAGAHFQNGMPSPGIQQQRQHHRHSESFGSEPSSTATPASSRPISRDQSYFDSRRASAILDGSGDETTPKEHEKNPEDMQVVFHVTYSGDVRLSMTAEVVLDFPMPSFVGIPLKLNITGITFNGVGILAYIKKRAHICFLSPEDAEALVGSDSAAMAESNATPDSPKQPRRVGGLLEEIKIESEMGENEEGKQVLKNVGKIEKFILEQVQRIFEEEFVYPSFWTFLV